MEVVKVMMSDGLGYWSALIMDDNDGGDDDDMMLIMMMATQGGRSCAGARAAPAEKFGLGRKF